MNALRKTLLGIFILGLMLTLGAAGTLFYFYRHPETLKAAVENTLSGELNAEVSIESLSASLDPLRIEAHGVGIRPNPPADGIAGDISSFRADFSLTGPFGRRTLAVKTIELSQWRILLPFDSPVVGLISGRAPPSFLSKLLKPLVDILLFREVQIGSVRADDGEIDIFATDWRLALSLTEAGLTADRAVHAGGRGRFELASHQLSVEAPVIKIFSIDAPSSGQTAYGADLVIEGASLKQSSREAGDVSLRAKIFWDQKQSRLLIDTADLRVAGVTFSEGGASREAIRDIALHMAGWVDPGQETAALSDWRLRIEDWLDLAGTIHYDGSREKTLRVDIDKGRIVAEKLVPEVVRQTDLDNNGVILSGPLKVGGTLQGDRQGDRWRWDLEADVNLPDNRLTLDASATRLRSRLAGGFSFSGVLSELQVKGNLKLTEGDLAHSGVQVNPFAIELALNGIYPRFQIEKLDIRVPHVPKAFSENGLEMKDLRLRLQNGRVDAAARSFDFAGGVFSSSALGPLAISMAGDMSAQKISLEAPQAGFLNFFSTAGLVPPAWKIEGQEWLQATATVAQSRCRFDAELTVQRLGFEGPKGIALGENIDLRTTIGGQLDLSRLQLNLNIEARVPAGEALYQQFYFDFKQQPFDLSARADVDLSLKRWQLADLLAGLKDIVRFRVEGRGRWDAGREQVALKLVMPQTDLEPLFKHFILDPFGVGAPFLKTLGITGTLSADLDMQTDGHGRQATGHLSWADGSFSSDSLGVAIEGAAIDFPVWYQSGSRPAIDTPLTGRLEITGIRLPVLGRQAINWPLEAGPNRLEVNTRSVFDFEGGVLELGPIRSQNIYQSDRLLKSEISVKSVDTGRFLRGIWPDAVPGPANGSLVLTYQDDRLIGSGRLSADVFGGRTIVLNPSIASLFSGVPVLTCEVLLEDIRLDELTAGTTFGRIDGLLRGSIENLEIADGQPQRFDLLLETERKKGVPQLISVKAVNSISQIGAGQNPFMGLAGNVMKLLPGFGYKKIGIRSSLHNDVFTVNGTIKENDTEYLVRRDGLAGVDVVNRDPKNHIRFKEMVKRIGRALASEGKPVVNVNE